MARLVAASRTPADFSPPPGPSLPFFPFKCCTTSAVPRSDSFPTNHSSGRFCADQSGARIHRAIFQWRQGWFWRGLHGAERGEKSVGRSWSWTEMRWRVLTQREQQSHHRRVSHSSKKRRRRRPRLIWECQGEDEWSCLFRADNDSIEWRSKHACGWKSCQGLPRKSISSV